MIVPSVDIRGAHAVQLEQGRDLKIDAGDPLPIARRFGRVGEIAVIDLDAALSTGDNRGVIEGLVRVADCRVGGGIRDVDSAIRWLDAGASRVILGTAARPEVLRELPRERVIAALDARDGEVVDQGWTRGTGAKIADRMRELREFVGGFLVTFVEVEGTMRGLPLDRAAELREIAGDGALTVAGGIAEAGEIGELDAMGIDAQVGMGLYSGRFTLAGGLGACLQSDRTDGLWPTVVCDERGVALGLCYSNAESLAVALDEGRGVYWSRKRGLWRKGESSGDVQELLRVEADCDRDALRFVVRQSGDGTFCHRKTRSCFDAIGASAHGPGLAGLMRRLSDPATRAAKGSYTARLFGDADLLASKLREEARELGEANERSEIVHEAADVLFFTLMRLAREGVALSEIEDELARRSRKVTRRPGDAKGD
ncbi:MAG: phosphoribosyl-ATP diphosphatase [Planctomycetota bacterium]